MPRPFNLPPAVLDAYNFAESSVPDSTRKSKMISFRLSGEEFRLLQDACFENRSPQRLRTRPRRHAAHHSRR